MPLKPDVKKPLSEDRRIGFALVGLGKLTIDEILPALRTSEHSYVAALLTDDKDKGRQFARAFDLADSDVYSYDEAEKLGSRDDVEAAYIVTPNSEHLEMVRRLSAVGKHILCEKPLTMSAAEASAMVDLCKTSNVLLMTAYRCQYTPEFWAARDAIQSGKLGKVKIIDSVHAHVEEDPEAWRLKAALAGGGPLVDIGIYSVNSIRFLLGLEPEWVWARHVENKADKRFKEVEEATTFVLGFDGGIVANCLTSYNAQRTKTLRVMCEKGSIFFDPAFAYEGLKITISTDEGCTTLKFGPYDQFGREVDHFATCIKKGNQPWTPGEEGAQDHVVMDAIFESARTGVVVKLPPVTKKDAFRGTKPEMPDRKH